MYTNEETGEDVVCPICDKHYDCEHSLGEMDLTFFSFTGLMEDFITTGTNALQAKFERLVEEKKRPKAGSTFDSEEVSQLFDCFTDSSGGDGHVDLCLGPAIFEEFLLDQGAISYQGIIDNGGGFGQASAIRLLFDHDPEAFMARATKDFQAAVDKL